MEKGTGSFGIVVPIHNGENHIRILLERLENTLESDCRLILVDDGSTDGSWVLIKELTGSKTSTITPYGVRLDGNRGQQSAIVAGLTACRDIPVITMDDDLSHPPELIPDLLAALEAGADLAYADPPRRPGRFLRRTASTLHRWHMSLVTGSSTDIGVGSFRGMTAALTTRILESPSSWPYLSAIALGLRPPPVTAMVPSPLWQTGACGRIGIMSLLKMEIRIGIHHGFPARAVRKGLTNDPTVRTLLAEAESWITERTDR